MKRGNGLMTVFLTVLLMVLAGCASYGKNGTLIECSEETGFFNDGTVIVVAMHGIPPLHAYNEVAEFMMLEAQLEAGHGEDDPAKIQRLEELDRKLKNWPLDEKNAYKVGAVKLGKLLEQKIGSKVFVGFNEFCAPSLEKTFEDAASENPKKIIVITTLSAPGNNHATNPEGDVLKSVLDAREKYSGIEFVYAWPYRFERLARLLRDQLLEFATKDELAGKETRTIIAAHGTPPLDMPRKLMLEYMMLHGGMRVRGSKQDKRHDELDEMVRNWPRTDKDAYWAGTIKLGKMLETMIGSETIVAYNEFCGPSIKEAFEKAVNDKAKKIFVISPMWEPNNRHSAVDVLQSVYRAKKKYPKIEIIYAWPYGYDKIIKCLCGQLLEFKNSMLKNKLLIVTLSRGRGFLSKNKGLKVASSSHRVLAGQQHKCQITYCKFLLITKKFS
jgi:sirohydrochlorin cobaltochelatase